MLKDDVINVFNIPVKMQKLQAQINLPACFPSKILKTMLHLFLLRPSLTLEEMKAMNIVIILYRKFYLFLLKVLHLFQ